MKNDQIPRVVDEHDAARIIGKKVQTMRNLRCQRKGPPYLKMGSSVRYLVPDLLSYLQKHRIDPEKTA